MTRKFTMSPIEPRTAGTLKGFGFTVTWGDDDGLAGPANGGDARTANTKPAPNNEPASHVAAAVGGDGAGASVSTDTESTAALSGSAGQPSRGADAYSPATDARVKASGYQAPPVDTPKPVNDDFRRVPHLGPVA